MSVFKKTTLHKRGLSFYLMIAIVVTVSVIMGIKGVWDYSNQRKWAEQEMLDKALIIMAQQEAIWEFMSRNQDLINYDGEGNFEYKYLNCSTAVMSIGTMVSRDTDYVIKSTNLETRSVLNTPDDFETDGVLYLKNNPGKDYWSLTDDGEESVFRYMASLYITKDCLSCHGMPKGEIDVSGFPKDGLVVGDFAGAISLKIPADSYVKNVNSNMLSNVVFIIALLLIFTLVVRIFMNKLVTNSLGKFEQAAMKVGRGEWDVDFAEIPAKGEVKRLVSCFQDMTDQLKSLYDDLESEVEKRTGQLKEANATLEYQQAQLLEMNARIQGISDYKSDVLAVMGHELRTPLASIIAFAEVALHNADDNDAEQKQHLQDILANAKRLLRLINNVLDLAKIEAGKEEVHWDIIDMHDLAASTENTMTSLAINKNIVLSTKVFPDVPLTQGDPEKLASVLNNLVGNAIKYTQPGGQVEITIFFEASENRIVIWVEDTGIGIPQEKTEQIFERFTQVDNSVSRRYGGTGLGLALARELVLMHEGTISVQSKVGEGSKFIVMLPVWEV